MAGIAIVLDLWRKNQSSSFGVHSSHAFQSSSALFSASAAATAAAASVAAGTGFASRALFGYAPPPFFYTIDLRVLGMMLLLCYRILI